MRSRLNEFILILIFFNIGIIQVESHVEFLLDGYPKQYLSGSIHYFRVHPTDWRDRLQKLRWAGFHAVQTYIEWASHEPEPEKYDFTDGLDFVKFIQIAREEGLSVILRPGPYICSERDMGGLPWWLLKLEPKANVRTSDERYMKYVRRWFKVLLALLKPQMAENGGPVIMVQVENEYGDYDACDFEYLTELSNLLKTGLGNSTFLFSTDNGRTDALKCAKIPSTYATVDFGPDANIAEEFEVQKLFNEGPSINSEFYPGWLDLWGTPHQTKDTQSIVKALDQILSINGSVNFYVFHGGTNFGFGSGSELHSKFVAIPTSYDFDAPISEAGDLTEKYFAIREVALKYFPPPSENPPSNSTEKQAYGDVELMPISSVFDLLPSLPFEEGDSPKTFEELGVPNGIVVYETLLTKSISSPGDLSMHEVYDRGYVFVDYKYQGLASRSESLYHIPVRASVNQTLSILVESQGRSTDTSKFNNFKGLISTPTINGHELRNWKMTPIPLYNMTKLQNSFNSLHVSNEVQRNNRRDSEEENVYSGMTFYKGSFTINDTPKNTFLRTDLFTKGYAWINNFLLGRYWPVMGPQMTLYVPHGILQQGDNTLLLLELEGTLPNTNLFASLVDQPDINGPVPNH